MKVTEQLHAFIWGGPGNNCNTYLIDDGVRILIDPGHLRLFAATEGGLTEIGLSIEDIDLVLCTHSHADHLEAVQLFSEAGTPFAVHADDWQMAGQTRNRQQTGQRGEGGGLEPTFFLTEGSLSVKAIDLKVIHTPGHSPGSITIHWPAQEALFTGDLIFKDGVGRTDLPRGDGQQLKSSIKRVAEIGADYLLSGHGDMVSGRDEVESNFKRVEEYWFSYI